MIGAVASVCFLISKRLINRMEIDDPLNIVSIHLICGFWGLIAAGIFQENTGLIDTGSSDRLIVQLIGAASIFGMSLLVAGCLFYILSQLKILRVGEILEVVGLDYFEISLTDRDDHIELLDRSFLINQSKMRRIEQL